MNQNFKLKQVDVDFYNKQLVNFLPDKIIDCHTHIWLEKFRIRSDMPVRTALWPNLVASENSVEDLMSLYRQMLPGKEVTPVIFGSVYNNYDIAKCNEYVRENAVRYGFPSLMLTKPGISSSKFEHGIKEGQFKGCKVYLNFSPSYIPENEIRIYDFLPAEHLRVLNKRNWIVMLHIARPKRLKDPVNIAQLMEIDGKYPDAKVIVAHIGRAYTDEDIGNAFDVLKHSKNLLFDISANTNANVMTRLIETVGPRRILFGSDMPLPQMRARRIVENDMYINLVPKGLYGDVSLDAHMREVEGDEAESLTFFMYEEIEAFRQAAEKTGLSRKDVEDVFYTNSARLFGIEQEA